jgi:hypothetical protein
MRRLADFQNRVLQKYARTHDADFIDIAASYPLGQHTFGCQFSCWLLEGIVENLKNSARVHSVRDRGFGGSNPLAATNFARKHWRFSLMAGPAGS